MKPKQKIITKFLGLIFVFLIIQNDKLFNVNGSSYHTVLNSNNSIFTKFKNQSSILNFLNLTITTKHISYILTILVIFLSIVLILLFHIHKYATLIQIDYLTKCKNRYSLHKEYSNKELHNTIAIFLDIDNFKYINDYYGHITGDLVLRKIASKLIQVFGFKKVYRISGDEFVVLVNSKDESLQCTIDKINTCKTFQIYDHANNYYHNVTVATGVVTTEVNITDINSIINLADIAMYSEKRATHKSSKKTFVVNKEKYKEILFISSLEQELQKAIENDDIEVYIHPIVDIKTSKIKGLEMLSRWIKDGNVIKPDKYIQYVSNSRICKKIDEITINKGLSYLREMRNNKIVDNQMYISFNLSLHSILSYGSAGGFSIKDALKKYNISKQNICIEISEKIILEHHVQSFINKMIEDGLRVAIDNFTINFLSMQYIKSTRIKFLKIDKSIITNTIHTNQIDNVILDSLLDFASILNITVVIEGVESNEQVNHLKKKKADCLQGYYFGKPVPFIELPTLLNKK